MGFEFKNTDFKDFTRLSISALLIGGLILIIIISLFKDNFDFPLEITKFFGGWIFVIIVFFFQQKQVEEKSKQIDEKNSKAQQIGVVLDNLSKNQDEKVDKFKEYLSQNHPELMEEFIKKQIF